MKLKDALKVIEKTNFSKDALNADIGVNPVIIDENVSIVDSGFLEELVMTNPVLAQVQSMKMQNTKNKN